MNYRLSCAQDFRGAAPHDMSSDISREAGEATKSAAASASSSAAGSLSPGPRSTPRKPVPRRSARDAQTTDPLVAPRTYATTWHQPEREGGRVLK